MPTKPSLSPVTEQAWLSETIPEALVGERVDRVVSIIADVSRREAVDLIADGGVLLNGEPPVKPSIRVTVDETIAIAVPEPDPGLQGDPLVDIDVVHVDDQTIVVNKAAGMVVHPGSGVRDGTLANGLVARFPELAEVGEVDRPGIVHRLDKGTSGLLMVARTQEAYVSLVSQLARRTVERVYSALAGGLIEAESGLIDAPLGRSARDATRRAVVAGGKPARTRYEVRERFTDAGCTLVECRLETGRTHQIRAHLAAIDHPVVGDERYGGLALAGLARPFLHAAHLGFEHPTSGKTLRFDAPLAEDLAEVLEALRTRDLHG